MGLYEGCTSSAVCGMSDTVAYGIYFYDIGAAVIVIIICAGTYITFYTMIVGMHFIGRNIITCIIMH